jgi:hypothetical protein
MIIRPQFSAALALKIPHETAATTVPETEPEPDTLPGTEPETPDRPIPTRLPKKRPGNPGTSPHPAEPDKPILPCFGRQLTLNA